MADTNRWSAGALITRREVLGLQPDEVTEPSPAAGAWLDTPVVVIDDQPPCLVTRIAPELVRWIRGDGDQLVRRLEREGIWWDRRWATWTPASPDGPHASHRPR
ncbi:MAG: hypothetical protein AAGA93_13455 [Actinomycetota bacterium]